MNELPVIGSLCLRTDLWDRHGANIATHWKEMYGERLLRRPKHDFREIIAFSPLFYRKWIWVVLIPGKRTVLFEKLRNM